MPCPRISACKEPFMKSIARLLNRAAELPMLLAAATLFILMVLTFADVIGRRVLGTPIWFHHQFGLTKPASSQASSARCVAARRSASAYSGCPGCRSARVSRRVRFRCSKVLHADGLRSS